MPTSHSAGTPLIPPSFAPPPSPTRGEGTSAPSRRPHSHERVLFLLIAPQIEIVPEKHQPRGLDAGREIVPAPVDRMIFTVRLAVAIAHRHQEGAAWPQ